MSETKTIDNIDDFKIFDGGTVKDCLERCLNEGYFPLNFAGVQELFNANKLPENPWYDTSTVIIDGIQRDATVDELKNIDAFYKKGGRLLAAINWYNIGNLNGYINLSSNGCFFGVRLTSEAGAQKFKEYDDALELMQSKEGQKYLINNPKKAKELYNALGTALMKNN